MVLAVFITVVLDLAFSSHLFETVFISHCLTSVLDLMRFFHSHARLGMFLWCRDHSNEWQGWCCNRSSPWRLSTTSSRLQTTFCWLPCMLWRVCSLPFASLILLTLFIHHIFLLFYSRLNTPCCFTSCFFTINSLSLLALPSCIGIWTRFSVLVGFGFYFLSIFLCDGLSWLLY